MFNTYKSRSNLRILRSAPVNALMIVLLVISLGLSFPILQLNQLNGANSLPASMASCPHDYVWTPVPLAAEQTLSLNLNKSDTGDQNNYYKIYSAILYTQGNLANSLDSFGESANNFHSVFEKQSQHADQLLDIPPPSEI